MEIIINFYLFEQRDGDTDTYAATLPGVRDHPSAEVQKVKERNREYNDFLDGADTRAASRGEGVCVALIFLFILNIRRQFYLCQQVSDIGVELNIM